MTEEVKIIVKEPLTLAELKEYLSLLKKEGNLTIRSKKTNDYLRGLVTISSKDAKALKQDLNNLNITRLKQEHVTKIIDILPKTLAELRALFSETTTLKQEDLKKILDVTKKYIK